MNITITEDDAMSIGIDINELIIMKKKQGFRVIYNYQHPAVGMVVVMGKDSLAL